MRLVAGEETLRHVVASGGELYLWPRGTRCCAGRTYVLEAGTTPPQQAFVSLGEHDGIAVWVTPGLVDPDEVHLELGRRGDLRAFWNGQAWIG